MHGGGAVQGRTAIPVVDFVNLIEPRGVKEPMKVIKATLNVHEQSRDGE